MRLLFCSYAKQEKTKISRLEKIKPMILEAKGFKLEDVENVLKSRENAPRRPE